MATKKTTKIAAVSPGVPLEPLPIGYITITKKYFYYEAKATDYRNGRRRTTYGLNLWSTRRRSERFIRDFWTFSIKPREVK